MTGANSEKVGALARPTSVVWYERLALAGFACGLASAFAYRATLAKYYSQYPIFYPIMIVCIFAAQLLWIWLIARKRQNWARWISLVVMVMGIPGEILNFDGRVRFNTTSAIASDVSFVLSLVAVLLLFRRDARQWFGSTVAPGPAPM